MTYNLSQHNAEKLCFYCGATIKGKGRTPRVPPHVSWHGSDGQDIVLHVGCARGLIDGLQRDILEYNVRNINRREWRKRVTIVRLMTDKQVRMLPAGALVRRNRYHPEHARYLQIVTPADGSSELMVSVYHCELWGNHPLPAQWSAPHEERSWYRDWRNYKRIA